MLENVMTGIVDFLHFRTITKYTCLIAYWMDR